MLLPVETARSVESGTLLDQRLFSRPGTSSKFRIEYFGIGKREKMVSNILVLTASVFGINGYNLNHREDMQKTDFSDVSP